MLISLAVAVAFGLIVVLAGSLLVLPVPLYLTEGCPGNYCFPNVPRVPLAPFLAALAVALWAGPSRPIRGVLVRGLVLGAAATLLAGLTRVAAIPFSDPYFTAPYRAYAIVYLLVAASGVTLWAISRRRRHEWHWLGMPLLGVLIVSAGLAVARREVPTAAAVAAGMIIGAALASRLRSLRWLATADRDIVAVVLAAFAARAFFGLQTLARSATSEDFARASDDGDSYFAAAARLAADPGALGDTLAGLAFPPGYTSFVATILTMTGGSLAAVVLAQAVLGAVMVFLVHRLASDLASRSAGLLAAALVALDMNLVQLQSTLTAEAVLLPVIVAAVWALARYRATQRLRWLAIAATLLGAAFVVRNVVGVALIVTTFVWLTWRSGSVRARVRDVLVVTSVVLIIAAPIAIATAAKEGRPRITTQLAGLTWDFEGGPGYTIGNRELVERGIRPFDDPGGSLAAVLRDPGGVLAFYAVAVPQRVSTLLFFAPVGLSDPLLIVNPVIHPNAYDAVLRVLRLVGLIVAVVVALRLRWWRAHPGVALMAGFCVLYIAVFAFLFPPYHAFRYRAPIEPFRFLAETAGLWLMARAAAGALGGARAPAIASEARA